MMNKDTLETALIALRQANDREESLTAHLRISKAITAIEDELRGETKPEHHHHYQHVGIVNAEHQTVVYKLYCVTCGDIIELQ